MTSYSIVSSIFNICLTLNVFESDIKYPSNTIMTVCVESDGFSANTDMDIDIKQFVVFVDNLATLYSMLNGKAVIKEPYGEEQFLEFSGNRTGHICIRGRLCSNGRNGFIQELIFENCIDQTFLPKFIRELSALCAKYR